MQTLKLFATPLLIAIGIVTVITLGETGVIREASQGFTSSVEDQAHEAVNFNKFINEIKNTR